MEPTELLTSSPLTTPSTSACPAPECGEYEDERDDLQFQLRIHYGINAVLALSVLLLICKDVCCCRSNYKHHLIPANTPEEETDDFPTGKVKKVVLKSGSFVDSN